MYRSLLIGLAFLLVANANAQEAKDYLTLVDLQRDATSLLLNKSIDEVTRDFARNPTTARGALLLRLNIYSRAGQKSRVQETLEQLAAASGSRCPAGSDIRWMVRNVNGEDLNTWRFYYERLCPKDTEGAEGFIRLWESQGDLKELDRWLDQRTAQSDQWLMLRIGVAKKLGIAGQILDRLALEVKANPADISRLELYLTANQNSGILQDVAWVADVFEMRTAVDYFELGERLRRSSRATGAKLLEKSLATPFTEADAERVNYLVNRGRSMSVKLPTNPEKQLRYWTKRSLAETYNWMNRPLDAQPIIEELVAIKGDDIVLEDVHQLAGATQRESGQRVVETAILRDEASQRTTAEYWLKRAQYYDGREEYERERDSYRAALVALCANPPGANTDQERFQIVRAFAFFLGDREGNRPELEKLLTRELSAGRPESDYTFRIARLITQSELDLDELRDALLARRPGFMAAMLGARQEWTNDEQYFVWSVTNHDSVTPQQREKIWSALEGLITNPGSMRAFYLAEAMQENNDWRRAIPLWRGYLDHASPDNWEGHQLTTMEHLFEAYCRTGEWKTAEKFLFEQKDSMLPAMPSALAQIAIVAAQHGAIDDAMRLWSLSANLDRRDLESLSQLARTEAKPRLLSMYSQMKKDDPLSDIPDLALRLLQ
jgi:hypothetical protein